LVQILNNIGYTVDRTECMGVDLESDIKEPTKVFTCYDIICREKCKIKIWRRGNWMPHVYLVDSGQRRGIGNEYQPLDGEALWLGSMLSIKSSVGLTSII